MKPQPTVLTDIPGKPGFFWGDATDCVGPTRPPGWLIRLIGSARAHDICGAIVAARMMFSRHRYEGVVTDGGASGQLFALLQTLIPWGRRRHVMVDCNWYRSASQLTHTLKSLRLRLASRSVERFVVWASHEIEDYAEAFGLPRNKLEYVPFHTTLNGYDYEIRDDGYLFAGGNFDRDYPLLVEAVRGLEVPTWIATTRPQQLAGVDLPPNVRVEGTTVDGFRRAMAAARLVVVPMAEGLLHSGGQQTVLNAMYLGKPTIAIGPRWAKDVITDGVDGLIVDYGDRQGLRQAIRWVVDHPDEASRMGEQASHRARWFTTERTMRHVHRLATAPAETAPRPVPQGEKRVLCVVRWPVGGIRTHILYTYRTLAEAGYRFTFVLPQDGSRETFERSLKELPNSEYIETTNFALTVRQQINERRYGMIHSHGLTAAGLASLGTLGLNVQHLVTIHDVFRPDQFVGMKGWIKKAILTRLFRRIQSIVSVSNDVRDNLLEYLPGLGKRGGPRLPMIPNGINTSHFGQVQPKEGWLRQQTGCNSQALLMGFMGRFVEQKGFTHLLQALDRLRREDPEREFHLVTVGSGDCRARSEAEIARRGLRDRVTLLDFTPDILPLLREIDLLVMPSLWEASPLLPMEAMSVGVPVLGSNCIGLREVLADTPARSFRAGDVDDLVRALREEMTTSRSGEAQEFVPEAHRRFAVRQYADQFVDEFDQMFDLQHRAPAHVSTLAPEGLS